MLEVRQGKVASGRACAGEVREACDEQWPLSGERSPGAVDRPTGIFADPAAAEREGLGPQHAAIWGFGALEPKQADEGVKPL